MLVGESACAARLPNALDPSMDTSAPSRRITLHPVEWMSTLGALFCTVMMQSLERLGELLPSAPVYDYAPRSFIDYSVAPSTSTATPGFYSPLQQPYNRLSASTKSLQPRPM